MDAWWVGGVPLNCMQAVWRVGRLMGYKEGTVPHRVSAKVLALVDTGGGMMGCGGRGTWEKRVVNEEVWEGWKLRRWKVSASLFGFPKREWGPGTMEGGTWREDGCVYTCVYEKGHLAMFWWTN